MENQEQNLAEKKQNIVNMLERVSFGILLSVLFLLPLFVLPFGVFPVDFHKAMFLYLGVSLTALIFLSAKVYSGKISISKNPILWSIFVVALVWVVSAVFSGNISLSLFGVGYEAGTAVSLLYMAALVALISAMFSSEERLILFYLAFFLSAVVLMILQVLHTIFSVLVPPWSIFSNALSSVSGDWYDLGIFFGLISLIATCCLSIAKPGAKTKIFLWFLLLSSLVFIYFVNFSISIYVLGTTLIALLFYRLFRVKDVREIEVSDRKETFFASNIPFFTFMVIFAFVLFSGKTESLLQNIGIVFKQISLSWSETFSIAKEAILENPVLGAGPNTFSQSALIYKPEALLSSQFWDIPFKFGTGKLLTLVVETGILGAVALIAFFGSFLYSARDVMRYNESDIKRMFLVTSFLSAIYLWLILFVYTPGFLIFALAFIFTGVFVATLGMTKNVGVIEFTLERKTRKGIFKYVLIFFIASGFIYGVYVVSVKNVAGYLYTKALNVASVSKNLDQASAYLNRAIYFDSQDVYLRTASEASLLRLGNMVSQKYETKNGLSDMSEAERENFRNVLVLSVQYAKDAVAKYPKSPENWIQLGRVYEAILSLGEMSIKDSAILAYTEAFRVSPKDPRILLALARVEHQSKEDEKALSYIDDAIKIKKDFTPAYIMRANIKIASGRTSEGISGLKQAVADNPGNRDNIYLVFYTGTLYYNNNDLENAVDIFEKLVALNSFDVDSRFFLGQSYRRLGLIEKAISQFNEIKKLIPNNEQINTILSELINENDRVMSEASISEDEAKIEKVVPSKKKK